MNEIPAFGMAHRQDLTPSFSLLMINDKQPRPDLATLLAVLFLCSTLARAEAFGKH